MTVCARAPISERAVSMRRVPAPELTDDLPLDTLVAAIQAEIQYLETSPTPIEFTFGDQHYS